MYKVTIELYNEGKACGFYLREMTTYDYTRAYCEFVTMANNLDKLLWDLEKCESRVYMENLVIMVEVNEVEKDKWGHLVHLGDPVLEASLSYKEYKAAKAAAEEEEGE